jgi:hypothetical protein
MISLKYASISTNTFAVLFSFTFNIFLQKEHNLSSWDTLLGADIDTIKELILDYQPSFENDEKSLEELLTCIL